MHTATPWRTQINVFNNDLDVIAGRADFVAVVGNTKAEPPDRDRALANAALIVRAVNNHAALLAALEKCSAKLRACLLRTGAVEGDDMADAAVTEFTAVIRKAKGGAA